MNKPEQRFNVNTRVRLREGVDPSLYNGFSRVGNEGWIRKRKREKYGYPQVFIEWDKDHWAYNGQEDGWTWEGQFEAVEDNEMSDSQNNPSELEAAVRGITENFVAALFTALKSSEDDKADTKDAPQEEASGDPNEWETLAAEASGAITNAPAYLVIALEHAQHPTASHPPMIIPRVFHAARDSEYALIVQSQVAHLLANLQDATIGTILQQRAAEKGDDQ